MTGFIYSSRIRKYIIPRLAGRSNSLAQTHRLRDGTRAARKYSALTYRAFFALCGDVLLLWKARVYEHGTAWVKHVNLRLE